MKNNKLENLTSQQLASKKKALTGALIGLGLVLIIACSILLYLVIKNKDFTLIPIAIGSLMTIIPCFIGISQVNTEIKSRKSKYNK